MSNDASLNLYSTDIGNEALQLNGSVIQAALNTDGPCSWAGPITLNTGGEHAFYPRDGVLKLSGIISGPGMLRLVTDNAKMILTGPSPNTYSGGTLVYAGEVVLAKSAGITAIPAGVLSIGLNQLPAFPTSVVLSNMNQIADNTAVTMWPNSLLDLNNFSETIGSLEGVGAVQTLFATLTTGGNNFITTFGGTFGSVGFVPLVKEGTGTMLFTGTGLGLAIVKRCVDLHGGSITFVSEEARGTTFTVRLTSPAA